MIETVIGLSRMSSVAQIFKKKKKIENQMGNFTQPCKCMIIFLERDIYGRYLKSTHKLS